MAESQFPSFRQDRAAAPQGVRAARARLSPLGVALAVSLAAHLALAAALFGRSAEPPAPSPIIAVEIVAGPPGQDARKSTRSIAAAPGAAAKPTPADPKAAPDPKSNPAPEPTADTKPAKTRQVASTTDRMPAEKPPSEKPSTDETDRPDAEATEPPPPKTPPPPKVATRVAPAEVPPAAGTPPVGTPKADPTTPKPKATEPPAPMDDAPPVPAPDAPASVSLPKAAPAAPAHAGRSDAPKTEREAPPSTALLAARPRAKPTPPKAVRERLRAERRRARERAERQRQARRQAARKAAARRAAKKLKTTRRQSAKKQTANAPAGAYVPPRPGRGSGRNRPPVYPRRAQREGWQGRVLLFVQVAASGQVTAVRVQRSSGHGVLDRAALRAVRGWRFKPAQRGGSAVAGTVVVPVRFRLTN